MSTKTKTHKTMKLPKGLPEFPPVPDGFDSWEYMGMGKIPAYSAGPAGYTLGHTGVWNVEWGYKGACESLHYIRAVKHPAPAKKQPKAKAVKAVRCISCIKGEPVPVAVLDVSNPDALVEQAAIAIGESLGGWHDLNENDKDFNRASARAALISLGIIPKRKAK